MESSSRQLTTWVGLPIIVILIVLIIMKFVGGDAAGRLASGDQEERLAAISELQRDGSPDAADTLAKYITDSDAKVAARALYALGRLEDPRHAPAIKKTLQDNRPELREAAVYALARSNGRKEPGPVIDVLEKDDSPSVRAAAATALGQAHAWDSMPKLVEALRDPSIQVRRNAINAIIRMIGIDPLYNASDPPDKREAAIRKIQAIYPTMAEAHKEYLERMERDPKQRGTR